MASVFLISSLLFGSDFAPEKYLAHVKYLASPELKGRLTGSPELEKAAAYIAKQFRASGLSPFGGSYLQEFDVSARISVSPHSELNILEGERVTELKLSSDFVPLNLSSNGEVVGPMLFAGYGITAPANQYDDYQGLDASGKIVLLMRHAPRENAGTFAADSSLESKVINAKLHGAAAVLLVNDRKNHPGDEDALEKFTPLMATEDYGLLIAQVSEKHAAELLATAQKELNAVVQEIDADLKPHSFDIPALSAKVKIEIVKERRRVHNVVGFLPGMTDQYIVLGAHYDHLGLGGQYSLAPSQEGVIHPGADDNASGTAGVLEMAHYLGSFGKRRRGYLFVCFAGEEEGLLGSSYFVNHPPEPLANAVAMINMDMIGRLHGKVYVGGSGTGSSFKGILARASKDVGLENDDSDAGGYGASDHTSFTVKGVPTLFFFSGLHSDYHKPSDTWDKINADGAVKLLDEIAEVVAMLADSPNRPAFIKVAPSPHGAAGDQTTAVTSGYGPYFGSIPDFGGGVNGVRFSDVRDGSPASQSGLKAGDVLVEFDGKPIQNLYDFTYALRRHKPGDAVMVKVLRDDQPVEARVVLTKRP